MLHKYRKLTPHRKRCLHRLAWITVVTTVVVSIATGFHYLMPHQAALVEAAVVGTMTKVAEKLFEEV